MKNKNIKLFDTFREVEPTDLDYNIISESDEYDEYNEDEQYYPIIDAMYYQYGDGCVKKDFRVGALSVIHRLSSEYDQVEIKAILDPHGKIR